MISAAWDANALASGVIGLTVPASTPGALLRLWFADAFQLVTSDPILAELRRTFRKTYFRRRISPQQAQHALEVLRARAITVTLTVLVQGVASHPEDDLVLATALSANADYLVTGDRQLQKLGMYEGVVILSPRAFLDVLIEHSSE